MHMRRSRRKKWRDMGGIPLGAPRSGLWGLLPSLPTTHVAHPTHGPPAPPWNALPCPALPSHSLSALTPRNWTQLGWKSLQSMRTSCSDRPRGRVGAA